MERFSKFWFIFAIGGITFAALNPYASFFAGANAGELFMLIFLDIGIIIVKKKELEQHSESNVAKMLIKPLGSLAYIIPTVFFLIKLLLGILGVTVIKSLYTVSPDKIWSNPDVASIVCLVVEIIFNLLLLISFIYKGKALKSMTNESVYINVNKGKKLNIICIITLIGSTIIGFFNPYEHYVSFIWNFWYPFAMFIYFINIKISRKTSQNTFLNDKVRVYASEQYKLFQGRGMKIFMIGALCFLKIIFVIIQFCLYSTKTKTTINFLDNTFLLNHAVLMFILATLAEIVVVITFSVRIWKEDGCENEIVVYR